MNRRDFLGKTLLGISGAPFVETLASGTDIQAELFTLGIASGDVTDSSTVLWTRLAPRPHEADGGMAPAGVPVQWELAADSGMSRIIQRGETLATPALGHSVHVEIDGLEPDREYWYRFIVSPEQSSLIGRTKTLPHPDSHPDSVRFITASCQNYTHGYFTAYEHMILDEPDFIIHLGDYIYDTSFGETFRRHETEEAPVTLADFRRRHALYKTDKHLQHAHAQIPFFTTIDNHDAIEDMDPEKYAQRAAAYQAWYEHMPVRGYNAAGDNHFDLYRKIMLGDLAQISLLDARQFRDSREICANDYPDYGFGNYRERCSDLFEEQRSMLGRDQEQRLTRDLVKNESSWNVIASPGPFLPFQYHHDGKVLSYIGAWDAYPANRNRIAKAIQAAETGHPIIVSGDVHSFWAVDGRYAREPGERIPVVEFVTSSVSANWPEPVAKPVSDNLAHNPQVKFYDPDERGYLLHDVNKSEWKTTARAVRDVEDEQSTAFSLASFLVSNGKAGFTRIA